MNVPTLQQCDRAEIRERTLYRDWAERYRLSQDRWGNAAHAEHAIGCLIADELVDYAVAHEELLYVYRLFRSLAHLHLLNHRRVLSMKAHDEPLF